jgi:acyl dehydratase
MSIEALSARVGEELGVSEWLAVTQDRIDGFADCTDDHQWIHVEPGRARLDGPFGGTIAHGFLTLSLLTRLQESVEAIPPGTAAMTLNYGLERVRFLSPVRSGARIRNRVRLGSVEPRGTGHLVSLENTIAIEGEPKPALVGTMLVMLVDAPSPVSTQG